MGIKISEQTSVTISIVVMIVVIVFYATIVWSKVNAHDEAIRESQSDMKKVVRSLTRIETKMGTKPENEGD